MKDFKNKVVVITGGATGIGFGLAKRFSQEGAIVRIAGLRENRLQEAVQTLEENGVTASYQICDVTKEAGLIALEKSTRELYGSVDVLVNNAGIGGAQKSIFDISQAEIMDTLNVNYFGVWNGIRVFGKQMIAAGTPCAIYTVGSENSFFGSLTIFANYCLKAKTLNLKFSKLVMLKVNRLTVLSKLLVPSTAPLDTLVLK